MGAAAPEYMGYEDKYAEELAEATVSFAGKVVKSMFCLSGIAGIFCILHRILR
jgi:hypothetical protein